MASLLDMLIFDTVYGSWILSLLLFTLAIGLQQIPDLNQLFADLEESVDFNLDQILTQETRSSLDSFANAGLQSIDYAAYINQTMSQISTLTVDSTIETLEMVQNEFITFSQVSVHPMLLSVEINTLLHVLPVAAKFS